MNAQIVQPVSEQVVAQFSMLDQDDIAIDPPEVIQTPEARVDGSDQTDATDNETEPGGETPETAPAGSQQQNAPDDEEPLTLADVVASLYRSYPDIARARQETRIAGGELLSAYGSYDTKFLADSISEPTGFYRNYRNGLGVARQTWWGGYAAAGYRIGRGFFQPWYKERQTNDGGEFKVAFAQPLLQGRAIDPQRVAVFQASLAQQAATPIIQQTILDISRDAAAVYWEWVAVGAVLEAQRELLELAEKRGKQFEIGVKAGKFPEIDLILNQQLIAERRAKVFEMEQKFRATSFKLGLFLRDDSGRPMVPNDNWLPDRFPVIEPPTLTNFQDDLAAALMRRPEPQILQLEVRQVELDRRLACNEMLPRFDFVTEASQDMGARFDQRRRQGRIRTGDRLHQRGSDPTSQSERKNPIHHWENRPDQ